MIRKYRWLIGLLILSAAIRIFSYFPASVERCYSHGLYPVIATVQRILLGWLPISIGDLLYFFTGLWLIIQVVKVIGRVRKKEGRGRYFLCVGRRFITGVLVVYVIFNLFWGLNYNRIDIGTQLNLQTAENYSGQDLLDITEMLARKINSLQAASVRTRSALDSKRHLFDGAVQCYKNIPAAFPLRYRISSVKPSLYSYLGNYLGFTGYYNPFSGEAQVNTTVPLFIQPFTTCHEIGHQLGYAKESEANFAGYLSASASHDSAFLYSVYFDLFLYSARYLYYSDSASLKKIRAGLAPGVLRDREELSKFVEKYSTPIEDIIDRLYSRYLQANQQPSGKLSYNEVVGLLIAYQKKYGKI